MPEAQPGGVDDAENWPRSFHTSTRALEHPVDPAHLRDIVEAARFGDEIELDRWWSRRRLEDFQQPREALRTNPEAHRILGGPLFHVPDGRGLVVLGPHPAPEAAGLDADWRGQ